ncbi:hypothetical protein ECN1_4978 [Escherichia coli N1]|nr:hypothetical protein ECN1_4978 [Escherichia coli N1]
MTVHLRSGIAKKPGFHARLRNVLNGKRNDFINAPAKNRTEILSGIPARLSLIFLVRYGIGTENNVSWKTLFFSISITKIQAVC